MDTRKDHVILRVVLMAIKIFYLMKQKERNVPEVGFSPHAPPGLTSQAKLAL